MKDRTFKVRDLTKQILRERILTLLRDQREEERFIKSLAIGSRLFKMQEFQGARTILFYASFDGEVETFEMMKKAQKLGKTIGLPAVARGKKEVVPVAVASLEADLEAGPYGIRQPKLSNGKLLDADRLDMVVVPGVAFDKYNNRLGRGGGYYDRFLGSLPAHIPKVGLAFDFQVVRSFPPREKHDAPVSCVITN